MRPYQVWRHRVGTDPADDVLVFEEPDERFFVSVGLSLTEQWVQISTASKVTSEEHVIPAADPTAAARCVQPREQGVEYDVTHAPTPDEDRFVILTNADGAVNFKLVTAPVDAPGRDRWTELVPHRPDVKLEGVTAFAGHLIRYERREGVRRIVTTAYADGAERELEMPEPVYDTGPSTNAEFETSRLRFSYTSLVTPPTVYEEDLTTGERVLLKQTEVVGGHDPAAYETGRLWATAPDGTQIPISYVHKAGLPRDGSNPCLLYGYGSYETSLDPWFSIPRLSLVDRGVIFAVAHVRGGGEMGRRWYEEGKLLSKKNTFTDFVACAQHLFAAGWTSPDRTIARGGSAGGLLMGAVANLAPEAFAGIVAQVPFVDPLHSILDPSLPLTVTEWEEWGNPLASADVYAYMKSYAPYENVADRPYPPILAVTSLHDTRVLFHEPAKWIARLRAVAPQGSYLLKTEMEAGHGGPSGRYDAWREEAFVLAWVLWRLGLHVTGEAPTTPAAPPAV